MLTDVLAARAKRVIGIELDRVMAAQLRMRYATRPNVEILESDFVAAEFTSMVGRRPGPLHDLRPTQPETVDVIGNLPYYITSDIVLRILELHQNIERAVIMVQREVADRIAAEPGSRDYGLLSATVQLFARVDKLFTLPPGAFSPPPQVHSSVVRLTMAPRLEELQVEEAPFIAFLKLAFAQKRKTLVNNLRGQYGADAIRGGAEVGRDCVPMFAPKPCRWKRRRRCFALCRRGKIGCALRRLAFGVKAKYAGIGVLRLVASLLA